jgi:SET domain-containing protein
MSYRPLPECFTIKRSEYLSNITGFDELGLFASQKIPVGERWITHAKTSDPVLLQHFPDGLLRFPMGGFFNHNAKDPNCEVIHEGDYIYLQTMRDIEEGEEITAKYTLYDPEK